MIERLWRQFADLGEFEANAVDVGDRSPEEAVGLVERLLRDGALLV